MSFLFNELVYKPIYNLLIFVYETMSFNDFGLAIILVTIVIKLILIPLSRKQIESQKKMTELQPKIKAVQEKYKDDKEKQSKALMDLYKENKTNPFGGCLPMIFQLVFLIAIYRVLFNISNAGFVVGSGDLYPFIHNPEKINNLFLGFVDLASTINLKNIDLQAISQMLIVILAAGSQFIQSKMMMAKQPKKEASSGNDDFTQIMSKQMLFLGPLLTLFIGIKFPIGLSLYWLVSTVFMIVQQHLLERKEIKK